MAEKHKNEILLESGTNEIEILEFTINDNLYGINVAKVREIIMAAPVKSMPHAHPAVEGIFKPRDIVETVIDLPFYLSGEHQEHTSRDLFIVTNFNKMFIAFRVHTVVGISRISWTDIQKPDKTVSGGEDRVTSRDFERIVAEIAPETSIPMSEIDRMGPRERSDKPIYIAEDSILLAKMISDSLHKAGYVNLHMFSNGRELWEAVEALKDEPDRLLQNVALIITDIEMPQMDGHRLTKLVKSDQLLKKIPLIIFSSLISEEMRIKGKQLGAEEQLTKPEIGHLVDVMDHLLERQK